MTLDEPIQLASYDPRWPEWYAMDASELRVALGDRLTAVEHFGSTAVPGLTAKPIIDILVGLATWPMSNPDRDTLVELGYEYLGESGVPGREYFRRREPHSTNLAVVEWNGRLWRDNIVLRDYLAAHPAAAAAYGEAKAHAWSKGARTLLAYSAHKHAQVTQFLDAARKWRA